MKYALFSGLHRVAYDLAIEVLYNNHTVIFFSDNNEAIGTRNTQQSF